MPFTSKLGIVVESIVFQGKKYNRYPGGDKMHQRYYTRTGGYSLHRAIWEHHNGSIQEGYHVHHKDGDRNNNDISNLEAISAEQHRAEHAAKLAEYNASEQCKEHLAAVRPLAAEWHASKEGKKWHAENTAKNFQKDGAAHVALKKAREERRTNPYTMVCVECGTLFPALVKRAKFCKNACASRASKRNRRNK